MRIRVHIRRQAADVKTQRNIRILLRAILRNVLGQQIVGQVGRQIGKTFRPIASLASRRLGAPPPPNATSPRLRSLFLHGGGDVARRAPLHAREARRNHMRQRYVAGRLSAQQCAKNMRHCDFYAFVGPAAVQRILEKGAQHIKISSATEVPRQIPDNFLDRLVDHARAVDMLPGNVRHIGPPPPTARLLRRGRAAAARIAARLHGPPVPKRRGQASALNS